MYVEASNKKQGWGWDLLFLKVVAGLSRCPDLKAAPWDRKLYLVLRFTVIKYIVLRDGAAGSMNHFMSRLLWPWPSDLFVSFCSRNGRNVTSTWSCPLDEPSIRRQTHPQSQIQDAIAVGFGICEEGNPSHFLLVAVGFVKLWTACLENQRWPLHLDSSKCRASHLHSHN